MRQKLFTISGILMAGILIIASCTKEGPIGPPGDTGAAGAQGPAGPAGTPGAPGTAGTTGTANVVYSGWLNVKFDGNDTTGWFGEIAAPKLVDSIINKGDVKVYLNAGSDSANNQLVIPLPITEILLTGAIINPYYQRQTINLVATADVSSDSLRGYHYFQYRYVLIPGGVTAGRMRAVNWSDYKEVKAFLGLKD